MYPKENPYVTYSDKLTLLCNMILEWKLTRLKFDFVWAEGCNMGVIWPLKYKLLLEYKGSIADLLASLGGHFS